MMESNDLKRLSIDVVDGKVFGSWMVEEKLLKHLPNIFLPLSIGASKQFPEDVWSLYEYYEKALPMNFQGLPVFASVKYLSKNDAENLGVFIHEYRDHISKFFQD